MLLEKNVSYTLLAALLLITASLFWTRFTFGAPPPEQISYRITTEYFGATAEEVERVITIPLENNLSDIPGITRIRSTSEFSKSRITILTGKNVHSTFLFADIRERVERTRIQFPKAVQKPRILASDSTNTPVFIVSFVPGFLGLAEFGEYADKEIKNRYQRIPGTGEIEIGGRGVRETVIILDDSKAAQYNTDIHSISTVLNNTILRLPAGDFTIHNRKIPVLFDSNFKSLDDFRSLRLSSQDKIFIHLEEIATVFNRYRKPDQISRINGDKRIILYIHAGGNANPLILCKNLAETTRELEGEGFQPEIIYSKGEDIEQDIKKILVAMFISMAIIFLFIGLFIPGVSTRAVFALSIPISLFLGISCLSALEIPIDTGILAGLIIGSGLIIDNYLVVYNHLSIQESRSIKPLAAPLFSATATTIIAFLPLVLGGAVDPQITSIAISISLLLFVSLFLSFTFLKKPLAFSVNRKSNKPVISLRLIITPFMHVKNLSMRKPLLTCTVYAAIIVASMGMLIFFDKEFSPVDNPGILFTHVEFPSGTTISEIDKQLVPYISAFSKVPHVRTVESNARRGNAQISITFDPDAISASDLAEKLKPLTASSSKGQFFIGMDQNLESYKVTITITGPDHKILREEVTRTGKDFSARPWVSGVIYHFKEEPPAYVFSPYLPQMSAQSKYPEKFAQLLRWNIQQPVSLKWLVDGKEQDVRISGSAKTEGLYDISSIPVISGDASPVRLGDTGTLSLRKDPDKLYRENRQNSISFSITTDRIGLKKIKAFLEEALAETNLPNGYGIFGDPSIQESIQNYQRMNLVLCIAILLIYALLAIQSESFTRPLVIISVIPFCMFLPLLLLLVTKTPITASVLVGITVLSGMAVNNYILIMDALDKAPAEIPFKEKMHSAMEKRFMPLFLSSGTSILAAIPILFTASPFSSTPGTLAIIVSLGLLGSFIGSFVFLPALLLQTKC